MRIVETSISFRLICGQISSRKNYFNKNFKIKKANSRQEENNCLPGAEIFLHHCPNNLEDSQSKILPQKLCSVLFDRLHAYTEDCVHALKNMPEHPAYESHRQIPSKEKQPSDDAMPVPTCIQHKEFLRAFQA